MEKPNVCPTTRTCNEAATCKTTRIRKKKSCSCGEDGRDSSIKTWPFPTPACPPICARPTVKRAICVIKKISTHNWPRCDVDSLRTGPRQNRRAGAFNQDEWTACRGFPPALSISLLPAAPPNRLAPLISFSRPHGCPSPYQRSRPYLIWLHRSHGSPQPQYKDFSFLPWRKSISI